MPQKISNHSRLTVRDLPGPLPCVFFALLPEILSSLMNSNTIATLLLLLLLHLSAVDSHVLFYYACNW